VRIQNRSVVLLALAVVVPVLAGCATSPSTRGIATPWAVAGIHSFKPKQDEPNAAKVDRTVARLLDDASRASEADADTRVAAR
jgi:hypothetical protein